MSTPENAADLKTPDAAHLPQLLERITVLLVGFCATLRPFTAGNPYYEPATVMILLLAGFALVLWGVSACLRYKFSVATSWIWLPLGIYIGCTVLAILTAHARGNGQVALDAGYAWAADVILFFLVANHFHTPARARFLIAILLSSLAMTAVYAVYQRFYGIPYFLHILEKTPQSITATAGHNPVYQAMLMSRASTLRATGAFGYPNALGGFCLLLLPLAVGILEWCRQVKKNKKRWLQILAILGLIGGVMSASRGGFLAAKVIECLLLYRLLPAPRKSFSAVFWIVCSIAVWTVGGGVLGIGIGRGLAVIFSPGTATGIGALVFAGGWALEYTWLAKRCRADAALSVMIRNLGMATIVGVILAAGVLAYPPFWSGENALITNTKITSVRGDLGKMLSVRKNYWHAAVRMIRDQPARGVGLDNFGSTYPQYKTRTGWAVKRAHNHYLELAATGGLPLLLAFLSIWLAYFLPRRRSEIPRADLAPSVKEKSETKTDSSPDWLRGWGIGFGIIIFLLTYGATGLFGGLSVEFFIVELFGQASDGSIRAATGSPLPLLIHGGVHFLLLPFAWLLTFRAVWRSEFPATLSRLSPWCKLGVLGLLLHIFADMHFSIASLSTPFWLVAGLGLAASGRSSTLSLPPRLRGIILVGWLAATLTLVFGFRTQLESALAVHSAEAQIAAHNRALDPAQQKIVRATAQQSLRAALLLRPHDANLHTRQSELLFVDALSEFSRHLPANLPPWEQLRRRIIWLRVLNPDQKNAILAACDSAVLADPQSATRYAHRARMRRELYPAPRDPTIEKTLLADWLQARQRNPQRPGYCLRYAQSALRLNDSPAARAALQDALRLQQTITDERALLTKPEEQTANDLLRRLKNSVR